MPVPASASSDAAVGEDVGDARRPSRAAPAAPRSPAAPAPAGRRARNARRDRRASAPMLSGYSGNFRHSASTSARTSPSAASSSGDASARAMSSAIDVHLRLAHAAAGDRRRADADAARDHRRVLIEGIAFLLTVMPGLAERRLGDLAGEPAREDVDEHQVIVGAAADQPEAGGRQAGRQPLRRWRRSAAGTRRTPAPALP